MKVLITNVYSQDNKGDAAILTVMIKQIKKYFKGSTIYASVFDDMEKTKWQEKDAKKIESFLYIISLCKNPFLQGPYALYVIVTTCFWAIIYRLTKFKSNLFLPKRIQKLLEHFSSSDLVIPIGGGYLNRKNSVRETFILLLALHPIALAKLLGKPTVLYSQSVGPYDNLLQAIIAKTVLNRVDLIIVREDISRSVLQKIGVKSSIVTKSVDAGFIFSTKMHISIAKELAVPASRLRKPIIGVTVRQWLDKKRQEKYEHEIAKFCDAVITRYNASVIFIPQVTADYHNDDDRVIGDKIMQMMKQQKFVWNLTKKYTHQEIKAIYEKLDYLIGTRFHSVIFSLTSFVPAIAIEYEHKTRGIMQDLQLSTWVIQIEDVTAKKLLNKFDSLIQSRRMYLATLSSTITPYIHMAENTMLLVKEKYIASQKNHKVKGSPNFFGKYLLKNLPLYTILMLFLVIFLFIPKNHIADNLKDTFDFSNKEYRGTTVDISQILPESDNYITNSKGEDLIDLASRLGVNIFRITNITTSKAGTETNDYTHEQWQKVLSKMQSKGIDAIILVEANGTNVAYHNPEINESYPAFTKKYIIDANVCNFPNVLAIDLRNEPVINENNLKRLRDASHLVKAACPNTYVTVGSWRTDSGEKYRNGETVYDWHDPQIAPQLYDIVDIYSVHIYSFDIPVGNDFPDPYTKTLNQLMEVRKYAGGKPIIVTEFGSGNGATITDQGTIGNETLQKNVYEGVFKATKDLRTKNILGAISYVFYTRHSEQSDGWNILKNKGDVLLPAAYTFKYEKK